MALPPLPEQLKVIYYPLREDLPKLNRLLQRLDEDEEKDFIDLDYLNALYLYWAAVVPARPWKRYYPPQGKLERREWYHAHFKLLSQHWTHMALESTTALFDDYLQGRVRQPYLDRLTVLVLLWHLKIIRHRPREAP